jgi:putative membrane protein
MMDSVLRALLVKWACLALAVWATTALLSGVRVDGGAGTYLLVAAVFATVNVILGTIVRLLTLPLILVTLGLFAIVINASMLLVTDWLMDSFDVDGLGTAVLAALIISVVGAVLELVLQPVAYPREARSGS